MKQKLAPTQNMAWLFLGLLALIVAFLGGSSRPDAIQIAALRPLAALFLIPAFYSLTLEQLHDVKLLVWLSLLLAVWMLIQILPLPPAIWQSLPERDLISDLDAALGLEDNWRPISLVPSRGLNALVSLVVPVTALLLAIAMRSTPRMLLLLIAGIGLLDAILGLLQVITGASSPLYTYAITNRGSPVGIFANENHSAVFSAIGLLVIARLWAGAKDAKDSVVLRYAYPVALVVVLLAALVSGSRAGLVLSAFALIVSATIGWSALAPRKRKGGQNVVERWISKHPRTILFGFAVVVSLLIAAFLGLGRVPGFEELLADSAFEDLRWLLWPVLEQMIGTHWLFGVGFGSFEEFYHIYEPDSLLLPSYVNQAHNDWAQLPIEGGAPALALLVFLLIWLSRQLFAIFYKNDKALASLTFWGAIFVILATSSIIDYPLRTPIFQLIAMWLLLAIALEQPAKAQ